MDHLDNFELNIIYSNSNNDNSDKNSGDETPSVKKKVKKKHLC